MKNLLLCGSFLFLGAASLQAQTVDKTPMIEHFTQASCGPCASQNPALKATLDGYAGDYVKVAHQVSWPGTDPMNAQFPAGPEDRRNYYGVSGVPNTTLNGGAPGAPNTVVTSATLASAAAVQTPYQITATQSWADPNTLTVDINVVNVDAANAISSADKIYVAMVENVVSYPSAPGSNGETDFYSVMRQMYDASTGAEGATAGATLSSIAAGATQNFNFTITSLPSYIADKGQVTFAIYVQNDGSKEIMQAGKTSIVSIPGLINVAATTASVAGSGYCDYSYTPGVEFTNNDATAVTEVVAEYSINGGAAVQETYTGSLAQGQSTTITFPAATLASGTSVVSYSIVSVNGAQNWQSPAAVAVPDETYSKLNATGVAAPLSEGMETAVVTGGYGTDLPTAIFDGGGIAESSFGILDGPTFNYGAIGGFANSDRSIRFRFYAITAGEMNLVMQKVNLGANSELSFSHAYRQYQAENDQLEISVSTDCGATWTSVFNEQGSSLATLPASTTQFVPAAAADWASNSIDLSAYDNMQDVVIKFTATSAYGNNLFIDDINIGGASSVEDLAAGSFDVYPNPATDKVTIKLSEAGSTDAQVQVLDIKGQVVSSDVLTAGQASVEVNTSSLASGVYTVRVMSGNGVATERVVIK